MSIVTMSETLGSLGNEIGRELAHALGYEFADREIIAKAAERFGESVVELAHVTEEKPTLWERVADTKRHYLLSVEAILLEMAARDHVILSGRGSTILLASVPHVLRVRVTAPAPARARRVEQTQGLTHEAALDAVEQIDRERAARIRFLYHVDWDDPLGYDLVLNTDRLSHERAVALIREVLSEPRFRPTAESLQLVRDLSLAARARVALAMQAASRGLSLQVSCADGLLTVSGTVEDDAQRQAVEEMLAAIPGAARVNNEIAVVRVGRSVPSGM